MSMTIFEVGGKQYHANVGDTIYVEKMPGSIGDKLSIDKVIFANGKSGAPFISNASIGCTISKQGKQKKILVIKFKSKKHYSRKQGHRQPYTALKIESINI